MAWTVPEPQRMWEPFVADERTTLEGFLDKQRTTLLWKCAGLTGEQMTRRAVPPSSLSLLGLVRHLTEAERGHFRVEFAGAEVELPYATDERPDAAFTDVAADNAEKDVATLVAEWDLARAAIAGASLDDCFTDPEIGQISLRTLLNHMVEEYARHIGQADLLRECIDGVTGD
ncbi:MAG TPA: DinB family protein [Streptosporangiaceae bacterium]|nr:DinB family protein [Streptosporangiaceae bacterium]